MFSLNIFEIGWILFNSAKETLQKILLARKCSYRVAIIWQIENKFQFNQWSYPVSSLTWVKYVQTEHFIKDPLENWFGRQRSLGSKKDNPGMADFGYNNYY